MNIESFASIERKAKLAAEARQPKPPAHYFGRGRNVWLDAYQQHAVILAYDRKLAERVAA